MFLDEEARLLDDPDHSDDEDRFVLLGMALAYACWSLFMPTVKPEA